MYRATGLWVEMTCPEKHTNKNRHFFPEGCQCLTNLLIGPDNAFWLLSCRV